MSLKRIWSALTLAIVASVLVAPTASAAPIEVVIDCVTYQPVSGTVADGATVVSADPICLAELNDLSIPSTVTIDDVIYDVTAIANHAFEDIPFRSVVIPDSVTTIGLYAFSGCGLESVTIGNSVTAIHDDAFAQNSLTTITLPASLKGIGSDAFRDNQLSSVTFGKSLEVIDLDAFRNNLLTSVTIPASVTGIASNVFADNSGLENVFFLGAAPLLLTSPFGTTGSPAGPLISYYLRNAGSDFGSPTWTVPNRNPEDGVADVHYRSQALATVTFDANLSGTTPTSVDVPVNSYLTDVPDPAPVTGLTFDAWYSQGMTIGVGTYITEDLTVYAQWEADTYPVTFQPGNGVDTIVQNVNYNQTATTPAVPTWEGHAFNGWFTAASGGAAFNFSTPITGATTAYAQWTLDTYPVTFQPGNGVDTTVQTINHGNMATTPTDPTWTGYTFDGWFTAPTGGTAFDFSAPITATTTLYAHWTVIPVFPVTATVTFNTNGHGTSPAATDVVVGETVTSPGSLTATGYTFNGWFTAPTGGTAFDFSAPITAATTVYAHWTAIPVVPVTPVVPVVPVTPVVPVVPVTPVVPVIPVVPVTPVVPVIPVTPETPVVSTVTSPPTATEGEVVTLTGTGYLPGEQLQIWLLSDPILLKTITADGAGAFAATVTIPAGTLAGDHHLEVRGTSSATVSKAITIGAVLATTGADDNGIASLALLLTALGALLVSKRRHTHA